MKKAPATRVKTSRLIALVMAATFASLPAGVVGGDQRPDSLWVQHGKLTQSARDVLTALRHVESYGLDPDDFAGSLVAIDSELVKGADPVHLDGLMNAAALRLVSQLHYGRVDPQAAGYQLNRRRASLDIPTVVGSVATSAQPLDMIASVEPPAAQYRVLKQLLARYRLFRTDLTSLPAPENAPVRAGDSYGGAGKLRWLLAELGDAPEPAEHADADSVYDRELASAVAHFQRRHGLESDGVIGSRTFAALTTPMSHRIRQIELTLERWRWLPEIRPPAVIVNVPQFMLYALPDRTSSAPDATALKMPVIVGQSAKQTPVFDSTIESVIFRPYWNVPRSILVEELLPVIARDSGYLARHEMEIVRGDGDDAQVLAPDAASIAALRAGGARLRQRPGARNALGLIKFVLPNPFSVYLHSTPEAQLFARDRRAFSHGCIRVSDASALAAYLLEGTPGDWSADAIEAATCGDETFTVHLANPVPVFILYGTVVIDTDGTALFFEDVYGYDRKLESLLEGAKNGSRYGAR